jgi:hypothetical protein
LDLGGLGVRQHARVRAAFSWGAIVTARSATAVVATWTTILTRSTFLRRGRRSGLVHSCAALGGASSIAERAVVAARAAVPVCEAGPRAAVVATRAAIAEGRAIAAEAAVVATRTTVSVSISIAEAPVLARRRRRQGRAGSGITFRSGAAERRSGRGDDPGRLGAHAEHSAAARRQDLEIEIVQLDAELLSRGLQRLFDALARELSVRTHQRRLPRRPWRPRSLWRIVLSAWAARPVPPPRGEEAGRVFGSTAGGIVTGKRGV